MRLLITILGIAAAWIFPDAIAKGEVLFFLLVVGTIGMAHGSLDHLVHQASPGKPATGLFRFYAMYLLAVAFVALIWWWDPMAGLGLFASSSAYHFGQAEVRAIKGKFRMALWIRRFSWGLALLALPLVLHQQAMIEAFAQWDTQLDPATTLLVGQLVLAIASLAFASASIASTLMAGDSVRQTLRQKEAWLPVASWALYACMLVLTPPLWGFTLYFGIWHAWPALNKVADELGLQHANDWVKALLPNYLPSLLATITWVLASLQWAPSYMLVGLLVLLSALTVPHMMVFERLYQKGGLRKTS